MLDYDRRLSALRRWRALAVMLGMATAGVCSSKGAERPPAITYAISPPGTIGGVAADQAGNLYIIGVANATFRTTPGAALAVRPPGSASYLLKLSPSAEVVYATYLPGQVGGIAVDEGGGAFVTSTNPQGSRSEDIKPDILVVEASGDRVDVRPIPICPPACGLATRIAVDPRRNVYIAFGTSLPGLPTSPDAFQKMPNGAVDAVVVKLDPANGSILYATYLGGSGDETVLSLAVDAAGNAYVSGETGSGDFPVTASAYQPTPPDYPLTGFLAKLNPTGSALVYSTYLRHGTGVAVDASGAAHVADSGFIRKLSPDGRTVIFSTPFACCHSLAIDPSGNVVGIGSAAGPTNFPLINPLIAVGGNTESPRTCFFPTPARPSACSDVTMAKFDPQGQVLWSSVLGTLANETGGSVMTDSAGNIFAWMSGFIGDSLPGFSGSGYSIVKIEPVGPPPLIGRGGLVSSANFKPRIGQGGLISVFGTGLADVDGVVTAPSYPLPSTLAGTSVSVGARPVPILAVAKVNGQEQLNLQLPAVDPDLGIGGPGTLRIRKGRALGFVLNTGAETGGTIFLDSQGRPVITHADFSPVSPASPARVGEPIIVFATGLGWVDPPVPDGVPAPSAPLSRTRTIPEIGIGGQSAVVAFSGLVPGYIGLYQINVVVPDVPPGETTLSLGSRGFVEDSVPIAVRQE